MDITSGYIDQCIACDEIQKQWKPMAGDVYYHLLSKLCIMIESDKRARYVKSCIHPYDIWLPRQDQLQEMMGLSKPDVFCILALRKFLGNGDEDTWNMKEYASWEQIWLAFVMKGNFGKAWDGKEWVKI